MAYRSLRAPIDGNISSRDAIEKLRIMLNDTRLNFLAIDLGIGLTLARMAATAHIGSEKRSRQTGIASHAYDTVLRFRRKAEFVHAGPNGVISNRLLLHDVERSFIYGLAVVAVVALLHFDWVLRMTR